MKAPRSWPNSSLSNSVSRDRRAVDLDERARAARALGVQETRDQLLARPALARDEHGAHAARRELARSGPQRDRGLRGADHLDLGSGRCRLPGAARCGAARPGCVERHARAPASSSLERERLAQVVEDPALDRGERRGQVRVGGRDHHLALADDELLIRREHVGAVHVRQAQVEEDQPWRLTGDQREPVGARVGVLHRVAAPRQLVAEDLRERGVVVDDRDLAHAHVPPTRTRCPAIPAGTPVAAST